MYKPIFSLLLILTLVFSIAITGLARPQGGNTEQEQELRSAFPLPEHEEMIQKAMQQNRATLRSAPMPSN